MSRAPRIPVSLVGSMLKIVFLIAFMLALVSSRAPAQSERDSQIEVSLETTENVYLLGEPVRLRVRLHNSGESRVPMFEVSVREIRIEIARPKGNFEKWKTGYTRGKGHRDKVVLEPGDTRSYKIRVLYERTRDNGLAFPEPGEYVVRAVFPLIQFQGRPSRVEMTSNTARLTVRSPKGADLRFWKKIRMRGRIAFIQGWKHEKGPALALARLVRETDGTAYHDEVRQALLRFYRRGHGGHEVGLTKAEDALIRKVAEVEKYRPDPPPFFPVDERLDRQVTYEFSENTARHEVFDEISEKSGVALGVHSRLADLAFSSLRLTETLREFMLTFEHGRVFWIKQEDGYRLLPPPELFPDDRRLEQEVDPYFDEKMTIEDGLGQLTDKTGLPFEAGDKVADYGVSFVGSGQQPLRHVMQEFVRWRLRWRRSSDGYRLILRE